MPHESYRRLQLIPCGVTPVECLENALALCWSLQPQTRTRSITFSDNIRPHVACQLSLRGSTAQRPGPQVTAGTKGFFIQSTPVSDYSSC